MVAFDQGAGLGERFFGDFGFSHTSRFTARDCREAGSGEVDVGEEVGHRATLGDLLGFRQVLLRDVVLAADEVVQRRGQQVPQQLDRRFLRQLVELLLLGRGVCLDVRQVFASGDDDQAGVVSGEFPQQRFERRVFQPPLRTFRRRMGPLSRPSVRQGFTRSGQWSQPTIFRRFPA